MREQGPLGLRGYGIADLDAVPAFWRVVPARELVAIPRRARELRVGLPHDGRPRKHLARPAVGVEPDRLRRRDPVGVERRVLRERRRGIQRVGHRAGRARRPPVAHVSLLFEPARRQGRRRVVGIRQGPHRTRRRPVPLERHLHALLPVQRDGPGVLRGAPRHRNPVRPFRHRVEPHPARAVPAAVVVALHRLERGDVPRRPVGEHRHHRVELRPDRVEPRHARRRCRPRPPHRVRPVVAAVDLRLADLPRRPRVAPGDRPRRRLPEVRRRRVVVVRRTCRRRRELQPDFVVAFVALRDVAVRIQRHYRRVASLLFDTDFEDSRTDFINRQPAVRPAAVGDHPASGVRHHGRYPVCPHRRLPEVPVAEPQVCRLPRPYAFHHVGAVLRPRQENRRRPRLRLVAPQVRGPHRERQIRRVVSEVAFGQNVLRVERDLHRVRPAPGNRNSFPRQTLASVGHRQTARIPHLRADARSRGILQDGGNGIGPCITLSVVEPRKPQANRFRRRECLHGLETVRPRRHEGRRRPWRWCPGPVERQIRLRRLHPVRIQRRVVREPR